MEHIKEKLKKMASAGWTEAKFGKFENAKLFANLLANRGITSKIQEILGHATTVDTEPGVLLKKHFLVYGEATQAHKILGKFV